MLIAQLSDLHVGGGRYREQLLRTAVAEINEAAPDVVVVAGDLTDDGYPDQYLGDGFGGEADLRVFVCHHHLVPVPGTGRERNQVLDAGDVLSLLRQCGVDLVLSGHRHVPHVWPIGGMLLVHSGTVSTLRTRGFPQPAYNLVRIESGRISIERCVPGGDRWILGDFPRDWPAELSARRSDPFVRAQRGLSLAEESGTPPG